MTATTVSQLSCFSSINRRFQLGQRSILYTTHRNNNKVVIFMSLQGQGADTSSSEHKNSLKYKSDSSVSAVEGTTSSFPTIKEKFDGNAGLDEPLQENGVSQQKKGAKIHDFCFGIPYGGLVLSGGLLCFVFSRNPASLASDVLFGGALLALSSISLKVWKQGKSSLPFILGQAVLATLLLRKNFQTYMLTKSPFPAGFNIVISAAMLSFYLYVMISGGNPPPKKLKSAGAAS